MTLGFESTWARVKFAVCSQPRLRNFFRTLRFSPYLKTDLLLILNRSGMHERLVNEFLRSVRCFKGIKLHL